MSEIKCTLTNDELIEKAHKWIKSLCESGGGSWTLRVPVDLSNDPDIIFSELCNRLRDEAGQPDYIRRTIDTTKWYWCKCINCGWEDSSEFCEGGHPIADTGDHTDPECPVCGCKNIDGDPEVKWPEEHSGIHVVKIPFDVFIAPYKKAIGNLTGLLFDKQHRFSNGVALIAEERERQIIKKGYDASHDEMESAFQLSSAAAMFIAEAINKDAKDHTHYDYKGNVARFQLRTFESKKWSEQWPWEDHDGREKSDVLKCLIKAGALIAAEIDRIQN